MNFLLATFLISFPTKLFHSTCTADRTASLLFSKLTKTPHCLCTSCLPSWNAVPQINLTACFSFLSLVFECCLPWEASSGHHILNSSTITVLFIELYFSLLHLSQVHAVLNITFIAYLLLLEYRLQDMHFYWFLSTADSKLYLLSYWLDERVENKIRLNIQDLSHLFSTNISLPAFNHILWFVKSYSLHCAPFGKLVLIIQMLLRFPSHSSSATLLSCASSLSCHFWISFTTIKSQSSIFFKKKLSSILWWSQDILQLLLLIFPASLCSI